MVASAVRRLLSGKTLRCAQSIFWFRQRLTAASEAKQPGSAACCAQGTGGRALHKSNSDVLAKVSNGSDASLAERHCLGKADIVGGTSDAVCRFCCKSPGAGASMLRPPRDIIARNAIPRMGQ